jgi:hypothetical protein
MLEIMLVILDITLLAWLFGAMIHFYGFWYTLLPFIIYGLLILAKELYLANKRLLEQRKLT